MRAREQIDSSIQPFSNSLQALNGSKPKITEMPDYVTVPNSRVPCPYQLLIHLLYSLKLLPAVLDDILVIEVCSSYEVQHRLEKK